jgi:CRISPR system Cascade subunit CasD
MSDYLVFQLYAPLVSWGTQAVGEERPIEGHPGRSALLGLLAAALGIDRNDEAKHLSLSDACRFGIKLFTPGLLLRDFHTISIPKGHNLNCHTRRDEVLRFELQSKSKSKNARPDPTLSYRSYLQDTVNVVAIESLDTDWPLDQLQQALEQPRFHLYLGRKSCPPAVPLNPEIIPGETLKTALDAYCLAPPLRSLIPRSSTPRYFWEAGMNAGIDRHYRVPRHDQPISRRRWQFGPRDEYASLGGGE